MINFGNVEKLVGKTIFWDALSPRVPVTEPEANYLSRTENFHFPLILGGGFASPSTVGGDPKKNSWFVPKKSLESYLGGGFKKNICSWGNDPI